ncbi:MAG: class I SAM-dependent methyltransferase [Chloroflexi bacterium]|nr:class I SAM-dependent methyltransferase [Chloroflexota bacterium]
MAETAFPAEYFARRDESDDALFYTDPRKVVHIDDSAINTLNTRFAALLPPGGTYLDLMSSWRSHLPASLSPARVVGLGMNAEEMADNPQLDDHVVQNLNQNQALPFEDAAFDAAVCTVSVQYLTQPAAVFAEVNRVIKPGGVFVVSFSNRCFPTKAVAVWLSTTDQQHLALVTQYFEAAGNWANITAETAQAGRSGLFGGADPLYVVWARKAS